MSNTAQRTPSDLSAKELVQAIGREVIDRYFPLTGDGGKEAKHAFALLQESAQRIYLLEVTLRKPPQQVTPEAIEAACAAYNEFSSGWDEGDNQTHAMREAIEAALSAQRGGKDDSSCPGTSPECWEGCSKHGG